MSLATWKSTLLSNASTDQVEAKMLIEGKVTEPVNLEWLEIVVDDAHLLKNVIAQSREQDAFLITQPKDMVESALLDYLVETDRKNAKVVYLNFSKLDKITEHVVEDQVITVQTGIKIEELNQKLAQSGQWFPAIGQRPDSTILELIESGCGGAYDSGFGGARNLVLGLESCLGDASAIKSGGKIVKNVTGYDLTKVLIGSHSWLGISHLAHLRLFAKPDKAMTLVIPLSAKNSLTDITSTIKKSGLPVSALEAISSTAFEEISRFVKERSNYRQYQNLFSELSGTSSNHNYGWVFITAHGHQEEIKEYFDKLSDLVLDCEPSLKTKQFIVLEDDKSELLVEALSRIEAMLQNPLIKASIPLSIWANCDSLSTLGSSSWQYQPLTGKLVLYEDNFEKIDQYLALMPEKDMSIINKEIERKTSTLLIPYKDIVKRIKLKFDPDSVLNPLVRFRQ